MAMRIAGEMVSRYALAAALAAALAVSGFGLQATDSAVAPGSIGAPAPAAGAPPDAGTPAHLGRGRFGWLWFGHSPARSPSARAESVTAPTPASSNSDDRAGASPDAGTSASSPEYKLGAGDLIDVQVWHEPEISGHAPIRPDGKIAIPLAGEMQAAGLTPSELKAAITQRLRAYVSVPSVTVIVEQVNSRKFNILGQVAHPGAYALALRTRVLDAIAMAGGLGEFAHPSRIYVLRPGVGGHVDKMDFNYKKVIDGKDVTENVSLLPGDTVVVP